LKQFRQVANGGKRSISALKKLIGAAPTGKKVNLLSQKSLEKVSERLPDAVQALLPPSPRYGGMLHRLQSARARPALPPNRPAKARLLYGFPRSRYPADLPVTLMFFDFFMSTIFSLPSLPICRFSPLLFSLFSDCLCDIEGYMRGEIEIKLILI
jgi:hypothetical protein